MTSMTNSQPRVTQRRPAWRVACGVYFILPLAGLLAACGLDPFYNGDVKFSFDNRTGSILCKAPASPDGRCFSAIKPLAITKWRQGCASGLKKEVDKAPLTVVLTVKESGREIYKRTASCKDWNATDRKFVIEQQGDKFIVTDSLSGSTPGP